MDPFLLCLIFGFFGLVAMAVVGAAHGGGVRAGGSNSGHSSAHFQVQTGATHAAGHFTSAHAVNGHTGAGHAGLGHGAHTNNAAHADVRAPRVDRLKSSSRGWLSNLLSPRVWFSLLTGFGACGLLLKGFVPLEGWRLVLAGVAALAWERLLVGPIWNLCLAFASRPARTLESAVAEDALAVSNFDAQGCGLVSIVLDGHEVRLLGRLLPPAGEPDEVKPRGRVVAGEKLWVEGVDPVHNTCTVSRWTPPDLDRES